MREGFVNLCNCKSNGLINLLTKLNFTDKYIYIYRYI